jgi:hypothetical protein
MKEQFNQTANYSPHKKLTIPTTKNIDVENVLERVSMREDPDMTLRIFDGVGQNFSQEMKIETQEDERSDDREIPEQYPRPLAILQNDQQIIVASNSSSSNKIRTIRPFMKEE